MKRRHAVSLVELLLTLSACTVILTLSAGLIHRVMHAQSRARAIIDTERTSLRLANQFRRDVHQATTAETENLTGDGVFLRLKLAGDQVVEYAHRDTSLWRILMEGGTPKAREEFIFPPQFNATISRDAVRIVTLTITVQPPETPTSDGPAPSIAHFVPVSLHAQALLNRDSLSRWEALR